jgi:hypothetical protein
MSDHPSRGAIGTRLSGNIRQSTGCPDLVDVARRADRTWVR